jgi:hypothetical protein
MNGSGPGLGRGSTQKGLKRMTTFFEGAESIPGRVSPVGWAAFPAGKGTNEQGLKWLI